ncbi:peptide N-glycanase [Naegleria gruberi]|uniref:Peptide N-glycanase n=1 Tax=Naegleria gruberi TaxID=5762 RepID=D2V850_NAEGR|nr:peptide N-glycanase [Naegleria gruberi]EFC46984.1 peptide N-glycanase [Naegleria gruberi]|eukprot:XP_002679728.1 peptide N-glycanase [Naegleria gruberi strain NEG-M]
MLGQQQSDSERKFLSRLISSQKQSQQYVDEGLKAKARALIPVDQIHERAQEKYKMKKENDPNSNPLLERFIIQELLNWFKSDFFKWVNNPPCDHCQATNTNGMGGVAPNASEQQNLAGIVELYSCPNCRQTTRFPRYNYVGKLLETRRGRCGEWAQCFTLMASAMGYEARYVLDWTDHVWTEVYLDGWCHADSCEGTLDSPMMYEAGWQKKLSYIIAFSAEEVIDVTKRYTQNFYSDDFQQRRRAQGISEPWLESTLKNINEQLHVFMPPYRSTFLKNRQTKEKDQIEQKQKSSSDLTLEEQRGRISGSEEWKKSRGETGKTSCDDDSCPVPQYKLEQSVVDSLKLYTNKIEVNKKTNSLSCLGNCRVLNDNSIIITENKTSQCGSIVFNDQLDVRDMVIEFSFQLTKNGTGADGFALIMHSNDNAAQMGAPGSGMGYEGIPNSIAIEFDTYQTFDRTRDPDSNHISIQTRYDKPNSAHHDYSLKCTTSLPITLSDGKIHNCQLLIQGGKLSIILEKEYLILKDVSVDFERVFGKGKKFRIGLTASTGGLSEEHKIVNWSILTKTTSTSYVLFDQVNIAGVEKKLKELISREPSPTITDIQVQSLLNVSGWKITEISLVNSILRQWKFENLFPIIDLLRIAIVNNKTVSDTFSKLFIQNQKDHLLLNIFNKTSEATVENSYAYCLVSLRLINNLFKERLGRVYVNKFTDKILEQLTESKIFTLQPTSKPAYRQTYGALLHNLSLLFVNELPDEEMMVRLFSTSFEMLEKEISREDFDESACQYAIKSLTILLKVDSKEQPTDEEDSIMHGLALSMDIHSLVLKLKTRNLANVDLCSLLNSLEKQFGN